MLEGVLIEGRCVDTGKGSGGERVGTPVSPKRVRIGGWR